MEDKDLDRLFRQKLETFEPAPSSQAWQQLEQKLQHKEKRKTGYYLSGIAASLLLLMGIWGAFELSQPLTPAKQLAIEEKESLPPVNTAPAEVMEKQLKEEAKISRNEAASASKAILAKADHASKAPAIASRVSAPEKEHFVQEEAKNGLATTDNAAPVKEQLPDLPPAPKTIQAEKLAVMDIQLAIEVAETEPETVIIRYTAAENTLAVAGTEEPEKSSEENTLPARKLIGFFKKVTSNTNSGLAELREAKNELLSFDRLGSSPQ